MKNVAWAAGGAALLIVITAWADTPATAPAKQIPLDSICSTSGQKELKAAETGPYVETEKAPALVDFAWGKDFKSLTKEGLIPATGSKEMPQSLTPPADAEAQLWAVVYFGSTGSSPVQFVIKSATWSKDNELKVVFDHAPPGPMTMDLKPYVAWIPLGKAAAGQYSLQLVAADKVEAEQHWIVAAKNAAGADATKVPATTSATTSGQQINVKVPVPDDQAMPGRGR